MANETKHYQNKLAEIKRHIASDIHAKILTNGTESEHSHESVIIIEDDNLKFNLDGGRFLTEISTHNLIDNHGYTYSYDVIDLDQLAELTDYINNL